MPDPNAPLPAQPVDPATIMGDAAAIRARISKALQDKAGFANEPEDLPAFMERLRGKYALNVRDWFGFHPPMGDTGQRLDRIRESCQKCAHQLIQHGVPSWELNHALETLRAVMMWASASVTCNQQDKSGEAAMNAFVENQKGKATSDAPPTSVAATPAAAGSSSSSSP